MECQPLYFNWQTEACAEWLRGLDFFYVLAFIWMIIATLSVVGHMSTRLGRKGFKMDFSLQLCLILILAGFIMVAFVALHYFSHGAISALPRWFAVLLFTLPLTLVQIVYMLIFLLLGFLSRSSLSKLISRKALASKIAGIQAVVVCVLLLINGAMCAVAEVFESTRTFVFLFTAGFIFNSVVLMIAFGTGLNESDIKSKRVLQLKTMVLALHAIWIVILAAHTILYELSLLNRPDLPWIWIGLIGCDLLYFFISMGFLGYACYDHGYTTSALKSLKPQVTVAIGHQSVRKFTPVAEPYMDQMNCEPIFDEQEIQLALSNGLMIWQKVPESLGKAFTFPHPINEVDSIIHSSLTCGHIFIIFVATYWANWPWWWIVLFTGMALRFAMGPLIDPQAWLVVSISSRFKPKYVAGPPKRFAQGIGFAFSFTSFILYMTGYIEASYWILAVLFIFAFLQSAFGMCTACFMFYVLMMVKLLPEETCNQCKMKFEVGDDMPRSLSSVTRSGTSSNLEMRTQSANAKSSAQTQSSQKSGATDKD